MRKLAQLAVIVAASVLTIMSAVGGADLLGPAHADGPQCIANATDPCPPQADPPQADPPSFGLSALAGGRRPEELSAGKCQHPASARRADSAAEVLRKHGIPLPTNHSHRCRDPGHTYEVTEPAPEHNSVELSRWLSPHRGAA